MGRDRRNFSTMKIEAINVLISSSEEDKNLISDGYHTFGELYEIRCLLFIALIQANQKSAWRASKNADGQKWEGWFVAGLFAEPGYQITFHLPEKYWARLDGIETHDVNKYFDGHNTDDIIKRLETLTEINKVTDYDLNTHGSKILVQIDWGEEWLEIQHEDLFDYLYQTGQIDGHDPKSKTAWINGVHVTWNPQRQEPQESRGTSSSYSAWIEQLVDDDLIQQYIDTLNIVSPKDKA